MLDTVEDYRILLNILIPILIVTIGVTIIDFKLIIDIKRKGYHDTKKWRYTRVRKDNA